MKHAGLALFVATAALIGSAPAYAQDASGAATELFNAGRDLMKAGDYKAACPKLAESARLEAKVGTLARLAECEERVGHFVSARARWEQAANVAMSQHDDRLAHVRSELSRLDGLVPKIAFSVEGAPPAELRLRIDDLEVGLASVGVPLPVEAGAHHIVVSAPGKAAWTTDVVTQANGAVVAVSVPVLAPEVAAGVAPVVVAPAEAPAPAHGMRPLRVAGIVTASVGAVELIIAAAFTAVAVEKNNQSNQPGGCNAQSSCPPSAFALRNDARTFGDMSTGLFIAGGLVAATGVVMWVAARRESGPAPLAITPVVGPGLAAVGFTGAF